ncbi:hypothetical protein QCM80_34355 [Bradyrhizobium sp. SSUT112]|uniref:hypothetical protein n=1 Tax=Bradyrhizobium sp. SSUT112 TaxID=3040604 RepID=UPI0024495FF3|nr:hypothetical protein [Bradyrhizobium sp. SSUT112]MDH2355718.1 hypothetical protein [Bradyrhizobium sp. SSUT112]
MSEKFDWDDGCLVVPFHPEQNETAVYTNNFGDIVLRQKNPHSWNDDKDHLVILRPEHAEAIVRAIIDEVGLPYVLVAESSESSGATVRKLKDLTAAERQRRHRAKLRMDRDSSRDVNVAVTGVTATQPAISSDCAQLALVRHPADEGASEVQETALTR